MTDSFYREGNDGWKLEMCDAYDKKGNSALGIEKKKLFDSCKFTNPNDVVMREKARARGYVFVSVQGKTDWRCTKAEDGPQIKRSMEWLIEKEHWEDKPIVVAGFSSGGGMVPLTTANVKGSCSVLVASSSHAGARSNKPVGFDDAFYSIKAPTLFVSHPGAENIKEIESNMQQLSEM